MGTVISYTSKLLQQRLKYIFEYMNYVSIFVATSLEMPFFSSKEGGVPELLSI